MQEILATHASARPDHSKGERACIELRNAVQWLARITRSYAQDSAEEISLLFEPATQRVTTPDVAPSIRLGLHLPRLVFQFEENGKPTSHALDTDDRSTSEVEAWLLAELLHRGFDRDRFSKHLPYEWPHPMSGDEIKYSSHDLVDELGRLAQRFATAATSLIEAKKVETECDVKPSGRDVVYFWPKSCSVGFSASGRATEVSVFSEVTGGPDVKPSA